MTQIYDAILKDLFKKMPSKLLKILTGYSQGKPLDTQFREVKRREADMLLELPNGEIFHLELQSSNDNDISRRMLDYYATIWKAYNKRPKQLVLYVGSKPMNMADNINDEKLTFKYTLKDIREIDCSELMHSESIDDVILSLLCRLENETQSIQEILNRISKLSPDEKKDYLLKIFVIGQLRKLDETIKKEAKNMPIIIDITENAVYKEGLLEGKQKGLLEGKKETIIKLYKNENWSVEKIADTLGFDKDFVHDTLLG